jgi:hypothetical protein
MKLVIFGIIISSVHWQAKEMIHWYTLVVLYCDLTYFV